MKEIGVASFLLSVALIGVVLGLGALQNTSVGLNNGQCEKGQALCGFIWKSSIVENKKLKQVSNVRSNDSSIAVEPLTAVKLKFIDRTVNTEGNFTYQISCENGDNGRDAVCLNRKVEGAKFALIKTNAEDEESSTNQIKCDATADGRDIVCSNVRIPSIEIN